METNFQRVRTLILQSDLSRADQDNLIEIYVRANDEDLAAVAELFSEDPEWIQKLSANYKAKQQLMKTNDPEAWKKLLEEEKNMLSEIPSNQLI